MGLPDRASTVGGGWGFAGSSSLRPPVREPRSRKPLQTSSSRRAPELQIMLVACPRFEPEPCRIAIVRCEAEAWDARDRRARGNSLTVTAKAQRPPVGGGTDRQHGWHGTDPSCWRYAVREVLVIVAQFRKLRLGSGPRDRGFESRLPDHSQKVHPSRHRITGNAIYPPESDQARRTAHSRSSRTRGCCAAIVEEHQRRPIWRSALLRSKNARFRAWELSARAIRRLE